MLIQYAFHERISGLCAGEVVLKILESGVFILNLHHLHRSLCHFVNSPHLLTWTDLSKDLYIDHRFLI